jgi:hypothetical protein
MLKDAFIITVTSCVCDARLRWQPLVFSRRSPAGTSGWAIPTRTLVRALGSVIAGLCVVIAPVDCCDVS